MKILFVVAIVFSFYGSFAAEINSEDYQWSGLFLSGDHSISNFDRGRTDLGMLFEDFGLQAVDQLHFSVDTRISSQGAANLALPEPLLSGFMNFQSQSSTNACFVHMTSHGVKNAGFFLADPYQAGQGLILAPELLANLLNDTCGEAPTVVLVSACYSGQFINEAMKGENRVILTAARKDLPSFGCSEDTLYTYWDGCLLEEAAGSETWADLYENVNLCIQRKETEAGVPGSFPQAFFGANVKNLRIFNK